MTRSIATYLLATLACVGVGCGETATQTTNHAQALSGGDTTVFDTTSFAYMLPAPGLTDAQKAQHTDGDAAFAAEFVTPPAQVNAGLGPQFNNNGCNSCHIRNGRGMPRVGADGLRSQLLVRVSLPADAGEPDVPGGPVPVPGVGRQLQDHAVFGEEPEAHVELTWQEVAGHYADGTAYSLRRPNVAITLADGASLPDNALTSLRQPPPVFGLGLLEAVPDADIAALADPDDADGDGISGKINHVWSVTAQQAVVGRFGHKANQPSLVQQSAGAYFGDMGVTNPLMPDADGSTEIDQATLDAAAFYAQTLGVPARRDLDDPAVQRGQKIFAQIGCADCHTPTLHTGDSPVAALAHQTIHPYTDLLVHDMGDGLADGRPDFQANGNEWRTAPLWGVGLAQTVLPGVGYLHDGRARTLAEAILWHGGEAKAARDAFKNRLSAAKRSDLLAFLRSL